MPSEKKISSIWTQSAAGPMSLEAVERRARRFLSQAVRHGTGVVRGVADVYPEIGTRRVELFLRLKEEFAPRLDLQILAYPQLGVIRTPGTLDFLARGAESGRGRPRRGARFRFRSGRPP